MNALKVLVGLTLFLSIAIAPLANAEVSDAEFQQLKDMLNQALERIDELEAKDREVAITQQAEIEVEAEVAVTTTEQVAANTARLEQISWAERIRWQGDFRYRYQPEETDGQLSKTAAYDPDDINRNRQRIMARAALVADLSDDLEVGIGVATGGDNPVSANATLGGAGAKKELRLDLAYFDWAFTENANLGAGKFKNPYADIAKTGLIWDGDFRPEGFELRYDSNLLYASGFGTWLSSDGSSGSGSVFSYALQAGVTPLLGVVKFNFGAGYVNIKAQGMECYEAPETSGSQCWGNSFADGFDSDGNQIKRYTMDYTPVNVYGKAQIGTSIPFGVFVDAARNIDAKAIAEGPSAGKKLDTAYAAGAWVGKGKKQGEWQVKAWYQDKEADSVLGLLTDSDFGGGGTDSKGYVLEAKYMLTNNTYLKTKYLAAEQQDSMGDRSGNSVTVNPFDVNILQLDVQFTFK